MKRDNTLLQQDGSVLPGLSCNAILATEFGVSSMLEIGNTVVQWLGTICYIIAGDIERIKDKTYCQ